MQERGDAIASIVMMNWPRFAELGWKSPSQCVRVYRRDPEAWRMDHAAILGDIQREKHSARSSVDPENQRIIEQVHTLLKGGASAEDLHRLVVLDGSPLSLRSAQIQWARFHGHPLPASPVDKLAGALAFNKENPNAR